MPSFKLWTKEEAKARVTTTSAWAIPKTESAFAPEGTYSNADMEPVPREGWTWTSLTFAAYWMSDLVNAGQWSAVASFVSLGLTWWESIIAIFTGGFILSIVIVANGIIGARLHTPFAVTARSVFGYQFAKFAVISRMLIAWFWFSINTYQGGIGVTQMLIAIWPSYRHLPNHLSNNSGLTSQGFLSFILFWIIQFPFCLIHPSRLRPLFLAKGIILPIVAIGTMGWAIHAAGSDAKTILTAHSTLHGAQGYLAFMTAVTACMGTWSTMACNIGDFSRYSKKPASAGLQIIFVPMLWTITSLFGAIGSQCTSKIYGEILWQPFDITDKWQGSHSGRFFAFVCAAAWCIGNIGTNITANSISSANDACTLFPKWIDIFRGQMIAITVGVFAFAPWKVLASAGNLISFMGSYSIVLAPIAGVLAADYFFVKKGKIDVPQLYDPKGIYSFWHGINWRSLVALIVAITPNIPGMGHSIMPSFEIGGAVYIFAIADIYGILVGGGIHVLLSKLFPDHRSLVAESVYAADVIEGRVEYPGYAGAKESSEKGKDEEETAYVVPVLH